MKKLRWWRARHLQISVSHSATPAAEAGTLIYQRFFIGTALVIMLSIRIISNWNCSSISKLTITPVSRCGCLYYPSGFLALVLMDSIHQLTKVIWLDHWGQSENSTWYFDQLKRKNKRGERKLSMKFQQRKRSDPVTTQWLHSSRRFSQSGQLKGIPPEPHRSCSFLLSSPTPSFLLHYLQFLFSI